MRDVDGNVFIDFLTGAGVLSLGHNHPELVGCGAGSWGGSATGWTCRRRPRTRSPRRSCRCCPTGCADRMKVHFCGPTGANAVDAAIKLCKTATGRGDVIAFQGGFHGTTHRHGAHRAGRQQAPVANGVPGVHFFPYSNCASCPLGLRRDTCATNCVARAGDAAAGPERRHRAAGGGDGGDGAGRGRCDARGSDFVRRLRDLTRELDVPLVVDEVQTGCGRPGPGSRSSSTASSRT